MSHLPLMATWRGQKVLLGLQIRVMQPGQWQQPVWREPLLQGELPCCLAAAQIRDMETEAMQPLIIAGTAFPLGEDCPCTGRVVLFQLTRASGRWQGEVASSRCGSAST